MKTPAASATWNHRAQTCWCQGEHTIFRGGYGVGSFDWFEFEPAPYPVSTPGYTSLVFSDDFDSPRTIDVHGSGADGFKWYIRGPAWDPVDTPLWAYETSGSALIVKGGPLFSYHFPNDVGHSFKYGYYEARLRFDPTLGPGSSWFPAWWCFSTRHFKMNNPDRWGEIDFFEAVTNGYEAYSGNFYGTVHDWGNYSQIHWKNSNKIQQVPAGTDYNQWHRYGCLWTPGKITWYFDGQPLMRQTYSANDVPSPQINPPAPVGTFSILDDEPDGMTLVLLSTPQWPLYVGWVRVWQ